MTPPMPPVTEVTFARLPVPALAYCTKPTQGRTAGKAQPELRCQTRNVAWDQRDRGIFRKGAQIGRRVFAESDFSGFHIPLIPGNFHGCLAYTAKPTIEKMRKNAPALTSTTANAPGLESTTFRVWVVRRRTGMSFGFNKTGPKGLKKSRRMPNPECRLESATSSKRGRENAKQRPALKRECGVESATCETAVKDQNGCFT